MKKLQGYRVQWEHSERDMFTITTSETRAKELTVYFEWMCDAELSELRVSRAKEFDPHVDLFGECIVNDVCFGVERAKVLRGLGWWPDEDAAICCTCGLSQWDELPESYVDDSEECAECR